MGGFGAFLFKCGVNGHHSSRSRGSSAYEDGSDGGERSVPSHPPPALWRGKNTEAHVAGQFVGGPIVDTQLVSGGNKLAVVSSATSNPVAGIQDAVIGAPRVKVRVLMRDNIGMFPTQAVDKRNLPKEEIVLPVTGKKVPVAW